MEFAACAFEHLHPPNIFKCVGLKEDIPGDLIPLTALAPGRVVDYIKCVINKKKKLKL